MDNERAMDDRAFWLQVRRGLLLIIGAIEKRYNLGDRPPDPAASEPRREAPEPPRERPLPRTGGAGRGR